MSGDMYPPDRAAVVPKARKRSPTDLTVSVITGPNHVDGRPSLLRDLELAKSAVLYADDVEVVSLNAAWLTNMIRLANLPPKMGMHWIIQEPDAELETMFGPGWRNHVQTLHYVLLCDDQVELETLFRKIFERQDIDLSSLYARRPQMLADLERHREGMQQRVRELAEDSGYNRFLDLYREGLVQFANPKLRLDHVAENDLEPYIEMLKQRLEDPTSRLLFDEYAGTFAQSLVDRRRVIPPTLTLRNSKAVAAGAGLVARLPAFPSASMEQILLIRQDLAEPLKRYRVAMRRMSDKLASESFNAAVEFEIDELWRDEVQPAIETLGRDLRTHRLWKEVAGESIASLPKAAGLTGGFYVGIGQATTLHGAVSAAVAGGIGFSPMIQQAMKNFRAATEAEGRGKKHELFFLYEAGQRLAS